MPATPRRAQEDDGNSQHRRTSSNSVGPSIHQIHHTTAYQTAPHVKAEIAGSGKGGQKLAPISPNGDTHGNGNGNGHQFSGSPRSVLHDQLSSADKNSSSATSSHHLNIMNSDGLSSTALLPPTSNGHLSPPASESPFVRPPLSLKAQGKAKAIDEVAPLTKFTPSSPPLPGRHQTLSHSQLFRATSPPPTGDDARSGQVPLDVLKSELNYEGGGLIPLAAVVERIASEAYETLQNLGETMSSLPSSTKRTRIFEVALDIRRQMIKLYVLTKWAKGAKHMQQITNVIGLTHEQSFQTVDARNHLKETRSLLPNARGRNHDIVTAIDVLSTGEPQRLPKSITDEAVHPEPLSDLEARAIVEELNAALHVRLTCDEVIPQALQPASSTGTYNISNGRVELNAPNLFTISLTLSGDKKDDRWYLLSVVFDYNITGHGKNRFPRDLWEAQRETFIAAANAVLEPNGSSEREGELNSSVTPRALAREAPISRLYNFLQSQALEYQLDIIAHQTAELARLSWRGDISWHWRERVLCIMYWTKPGPLQAFAAPAGTSTKSEGGKWNPTRGGELQFQVTKEELDSASGDTLKLLSLRDDDDTPESEGQNAEDQEIRLRLTLTWKLDGHLASYRGGRTEVRATVNAQDLDAEAILENITAQHALMAVKAIKERLENSNAFKKAMLSPMSSMLQENDASSAALVIRLHEAIVIRLRVDAKTGQMSLTPLPAPLSLSDRLQSGSVVPSVGGLVPPLSASLSATRFKEATRLLNAAPEAVTDIVLRLRTSAICDDLEAKADRVGLACLRRLNLGQEEYSKFGNSQPSNILFLPLMLCPTFHLAVVVRDYGIEVALVCAMQAVYGDGSIGTSFVIQSLQWLDVLKIINATTEPDSSALGKRRRGHVSSRTGEIQMAANPNACATTLYGDELARLHSYATALTLSSQVETQLSLRGVAYFYIPTSAKRAQRSAARNGRTPFAYQRCGSLIPFITLRATNFFGPTAAALLRRSLVLRIREYWDPKQCHLCLVAKLQFEASPGSIENHNDTRVVAPQNSDTKDIAFLDVTNSTIVFQTRDLSQALDLFVFEWHRISKIASLAAHLSKGSSQAKLLRFALQRVEFAYGVRDGESLTCQVRWDQGQIAQGYRLSFGSSSTALHSNPHALISRHLETLLNISVSLPDWRAFLMLLEWTLPILANLGSYLSEDAGEQAEECKPDVEFLSSTWYQVIFVEKYKLDFRLAKGERVCISDAAGVGLEGAKLQEGELWKHPIPQLEETLSQFAVDGGLVLGRAMLLPIGKAGLLKKLIDKVSEAILIEEGLK